MNRIASLAMLFALAFAALADAPALAALTAQDLASVGVAPPPGARLPLDAPLTDLDGAQTVLGRAIGGHPAVVVFVDYACTQLCSPILGVTARALAASKLSPGADYRLVVIGFNPKATVDDARQMAEGEIGARAIGDWALALRADAPTATRLTAAVGYTYVYDSALRRYAHPGVVFVVGADGALARVLSGLSLTGDDLRLALVEAGRGKIGALSDQIRLLCYGFSASVGYYADTIRIMLGAAGAATMLALALGVVAASRMAGRRRA